MRSLFETEFEEDVLTIEDTDTQLSKKIIVFNDDYNSFQHVISCFISYCEHELEQAEQCAMIIHNKGKCSVKEGGYDKLKPIKQALCEAGINAEIE